TDAQAPAGRRTQYWETLGHRAVWDNGWKAVTAHTPGVPYEEDQWRLYDTHADFSESRDLAEAEPDRLQQLQQPWWREAGRNDVFPLDDRPLQKLLMERPPTGLFAVHRIVLRPGRSTRAYTEVHNRLNPGTRRPRPPLPPRRIGGRGPPFQRARPGRVSVLSRRRHGLVRTRRPGGSGRGERGTCGREDGVLTA